MNKWAAIFLSVAIIAITTLIITDYKDKRPKLIKKIEVKKEEVQKKPEPQVKTVVKYRPDPKTQQELKKVKTELTASKANYEKLLTMYRTSLSIIDKYKEFFENNNFCVFNYDQQRFEHYGKDASAKCYFKNGTNWVVREAETFKQYVEERLP